MVLSQPLIINYFKTALEIHKKTQIGFAVLIAKLTGYFGFKVKRYFLL